MLKLDLDPDFAESDGVPDQVLYNKNVKGITVEHILDQQILMTSEAQEKPPDLQNAFKMEGLNFFLSMYLFISLDLDLNSLNQM